MALAVLVAADAAAYAQVHSPRVFVLDQGAPSVTAVDLASGKTLQTAALEGSPSVLLRTRDGKRLLVLDRGTGKDAGEAGFQAKTKSSLTIVDAAKFAPQARIELGAGLEDSVMLSDGGDRLAVICPGYVGKRPEDNLPRELVIVDVAAGQVSGRVPLARPAAAFFATPDGKTAVVLAQRGKPKQTPEPAAELRIIDLRTATSVATLTFDGDPRDPVLSPDGKYVYLLDRGHPSGNPDKNVNGRLHVISLESRKVENAYDVGSKPRGLVLDETAQQLLLVSDGTPVKGQKNRPGELRAIRGARIVGPVATVPSPEYIRATADGKRLFAVSWSAVTTLNSQDLSQVAEMREHYLGEEFALSPDGRRAFAVAQQNLYTYDLENGTQLDKVVTGRMGSRIFAAVTAAADTANSKADARREAEQKGQTYYTYTEYSVRDPNQSIAVRPDSKTVYVVNRQTSDLTIVDAETGHTIEKVGADGSAVHFMSGAGIALVMDDGAVHAVDLTTNKKLDDLASGSDYSFKFPEISADGKYAVINAGAGVLLVDGTGGQPTGRVLPFKRVADLAVEW
jgi:DNA-binding beta-propeller fold protein YncE